MLSVDLPSWFSMSATSSLFTVPSLSRSRIWKPSRKVRTCAGCSWDNALLWPVMDVEDAVVTGAGRCARGDPNISGDGCCVVVCPLGVRLSVVPVGVDAANFEELLVWPDFDGDAEGVVCRSGDGDAGDSGRRKGELREDPNPPPWEDLRCPAGSA